MRCGEGTIFATETPVALATLRAEGGWADLARPNILELVPTATLERSGLSQEASSGHRRNGSGSAGTVARRSSGTEAGVVAAGVALIAAIASASGTCAPPLPSTKCAGGSAECRPPPQSTQSDGGADAEADPPSRPKLAPWPQPRTPAAMVLTPGNAVVPLSTRRTPRLPSPLEGCDTARRRAGSGDSADESECSGSGLWSESPVSVRTAARQRSSSSCRGGFRRRAGFLHTVSPVPAWALRFE